MSNEQNTPETPNENDKGRIAMEAVEAAIRELESTCAEHGLALGVAILVAPSRTKPIVWQGDRVSLDHALGLCQSTTIHFSQRVLEREREQTAELDAGLAALRTTVDGLKEQVRAHTVALQADAK